MPGYSGTPLAKKLGIKAGHRVALVGAPPTFEETLDPLPQGVHPVRRVRGRYDVIVFFAGKRAILDRRLESLARAIVDNGGLWVGWPKKSSGVPTDLDFAAVQGAGLALGLVDNKVCAIDDTWSGLRFVIRLRDRARALRG